MADINSSKQFFLIGSVRSGTTMLRNVIRSIANVPCPEETHYFRWSWPYDSRQFNGTVEAKLMERHREIDNVQESKFREVRERSLTKKDLQSGYMDIFIEANKYENKNVWLDKTPQNLYGLLLISAEFESAKFIHIYRNPLNVVASLKVGKVMKETSIIAASNYWRESEQIIQEYKKGFSDRVHSINYEDFTSEPVKFVTELFRFLDLNIEVTEEQLKHIKKEHNNFKKILTPEEIKLTKKICDPIINKLPNDYKFSEYMEI